MPGTKAFVQFRGHGSSWTGTPGYQPLADDLLAAADDVGATQAFGVSLGAGALLRLLCQHPTRFTKVVLYLPAAFDTPVRRAGALVEALRAQDARAVEAEVRSELPKDLSGASVEAYVSARTRLLLESDLVPLLEALVTDPPVIGDVRAVTADVLVLGQEGDPVHPASVAREIDAALPLARSVVFAQPGALFHERARLRALIVGHLAGPTG